MEAISLKCPNCGAVLTVPDMYVGRTSKCGRCRHVVAIRPPRPRESIDAARGMRGTDWSSVIMNIALATLLILLAGILISYII